MLQQQRNLGLTLDFYVLYIFTDGNIAFSVEAEFHVIESSYKRISEIRKKIGMKLKTKLQQKKNNN